MTYLIQLLPTEDECITLREALVYYLGNPDNFSTEDDKMRAWKLLSTLTTKVLEAKNRG